MIKLNKLFFLAFSITLFAFLACDTDKYLSSNISTEPDHDKTKVSGSVLRFDTDDPVENAIVQFAYHRGETNAQGYFEIEVAYGQDNDRNSLAPVIIQAEKYIDFYEFEYLLPIPKNYVFTIYWAPPILLENALLFDPEGPPRKILQAIVRDYEGLDNIDRIYGEFTFDKTVIHPEEMVEVPLHLISKIDSITGYFQSDIFSREILHGTGYINYPIIKTDKSGYADTTRIRYYLFSPDHPIYPVDWGDGIDN